MQKLINTVKQVSTRAFLSLVWSSLHIFSFYTLCKFCRDFRLRLLVHVLLQKTGASMLSEDRKLVIVLPLILAFLSDITLSRKKYKREKARNGIVTFSDIINHSSVTPFT